MKIQSMQLLNRFLHLCKELPLITLIRYYTGMLSCRCPLTVHVNLCDCSCPCWQRIIKLSVRDQSSIGHTPTHELSYPNTQAVMFLQSNAQSDFNNSPVYHSINRIEKPNQALEWEKSETTSDLTAPPCNPSGDEGDKTTTAGSYSSSSAEAGSEAFGEDAAEVGDDDAKMNSGVELSSAAVVRKVAESLKDYRVDGETVEALREVLNQFCGTKNYHNYTNNKKGSDGSCRRYEYRVAAVGRCHRIVASQH